MLKIALLLPLSLTAQEVLPELIVTANRTAESATGTPYSTEVLTAEDLQKNAARSLPDAFADTPGVLVQKTSPGHGSPYIRGFTGRQNLLLQDGVRLNNSTWRSGPVQYWNTLDSQAIEQLELIKSQGSVIYGSDAIGGTVNTLSKSSGFRDEEGFFTRGAAYYRFDTNSKSHLGRLEQAIGQGDDWGLMLGVSGKDVGDIKDSAVGRMKNTGYSEQSFDFKFEYALSEYRTLTLAHSYLDQGDISRWHSTIFNPGWTHGRYFATPGSDLERSYDQERSLTYLRLEDSESSLSWIERWQATLSFQKSQDSEFRLRNSGRSDLRILDVNTYGVSFQAESGNLLWGVDYYHDDVASSGFRNGALRPSNRPIADDASYDSTGLFANYSRQLTDRLSYDLGARFTYARADWDGYQPAGTTVDQSGSSSWENVSLSARALYDLDDFWSLFGSVSQAFRAPNLDDLTGSQFALNGLDSNGSPNVDPETYLTSELGSRFENDTLTFQLGGYYTFINDGIIVIDDGAGGLVTTNGSEGYIYGFEAIGAWKFQPQWELAAQIAWQDGKQKEGGIEDTIRRMHPLMGSVSLTWTHPSDDFWVTARVAATTHQNNLSSLAASDTQRIPINGTPGSLIPSIYAGWQVRENLQLGLALENLTDEDYRIHGSGQNAAGLNATLSAKLEW
ncbi:MAG: TonB-dependent receptor [Akkermansiaceae bacterium]